MIYIFIEGASMSMNAPVEPTTSDSDFRQESFTLHKDAGQAEIMERANRIVTAFEN